MYYSFFTYCNEALSYDTIALASVLMFAAVAVQAVLTLTFSPKTDEDHPLTCTHLAV